MMQNEPDQADDKDAIIEDAIRKSMSKMTKKSEKFAARVSMTRVSKHLTQSLINE